MQKRNKVIGKRGCKKWSVNTRRTIRAVIARVTIIAIIATLSPLVVYAEEEQQFGQEQLLETSVEAPVLEQLNEQGQELQEQLQEQVELLAEESVAEEQVLAQEVETQPMTIWEAIEMLPPEKRQLVRINARVIHTEANSTKDANECYRVGTVFMNRVERQDFPSNINTLLKYGYTSYKNKYWVNDELTIMEVEIAYDIVVNHARVFDIEVIYQAKNVTQWTEPAGGMVVYQSQWHQYGTLSYNPNIYPEEKEINVWEVWLPADKF